MSIAAIRQPEVITIDAGASLRDAANSMRAHHIGALVVTVEAAGHEQAVGVITDRDLAIEILARDLCDRVVHVDGPDLAFHERRNGLAHDDPPAVSLPRVAERYSTSGSTA